MDARIGQLCRDGKTVYYFQPQGGEYKESPVLAEIEAALAEHDAPRGKQFATFGALKEVVSAARDAAERQARRDCGKGYLRSRGAWFITLSDTDGLTEPKNENTYYGRPITARELQRLIDNVLANYPGVDSIEVAGGFDFAENLQAYADCAYDPWVSEWSLVCETGDRWTTTLSKSST
ncbi:hypothetical protein ACU4GI_32720 [Cupriavidus basilensis]